MVNVPFASVYLCIIWKLIFDSYLMQKCHIHSLNKFFPPCYFITYFLSRFSYNSIPFTLLFPIYKQIKNIFNTAELEFYNNGNIGLSLFRSNRRRNYYISMLLCSKFVGSRVNASIHSLHRFFLFNKTFSVAMSAILLL